jgi:hypothetical protein
MTNDRDDDGIQRMPYGEASSAPPPPPGAYGTPAGYPGQADVGQGYQPQGYQPQGYQPQGYESQGYQSQPYPTQGYQPQSAFAGSPAPTNGMGVAGFVTGLLGLVLCWVPFLGLILAACGIILSGVGMAQAKRTGASTGLAIAGLVLGILALIPSLIFLVAVLSVTTAP